MLPHELAEKIDRLMSEGKYSQRAIARRLGISRGAVQMATRKTDRIRAPLTHVPREGFFAPGGVYVRCPGCGGKVRVPCLACSLRRMKS